MHTNITITGLHCASCKFLIEDVAKEIPGVIACTVDYTTGQTKLEYDDRFKIEELKKHIEALGAYQVIL